MQTLLNIGIFLVILTLGVLALALLIDRYLAWVAAGEPDVNGAPERDANPDYKP